MPDEKASTTNQAKFKLRPGDWWHLGIWNFFVFFTLAVLIGVPLLLPNSASMSICALQIMLGPGLVVYGGIHSEMVFRVAKLEQRLAELESSRRS